MVKLKLNKLKRFMQVSSGTLYLAGTSYAVLKKEDSDRLLLLKDTGGDPIFAVDDSVSEEVAPKKEAAAAPAPPTPAAKNTKAVKV